MEGAKHDDEGFLHWRIYQCHWVGRHGSYSIAERAKREGRNPRTGEKIKIPASKVVKFKAGKTLSEKVK
jgi:hypothetical protein